MKHLSHESRLINCLLDRYARATTLARPVKDSSANVVVEFGVSLIQILDFDEIKQIVTTSMWKNYVGILVGFIQYRFLQGINNYKLITFGRFGSIAIKVLKQEFLNTFLNIFLDVMYVD